MYARKENRTEQLLHRLFGVERRMNSSGVPHRIQHSKVKGVSLCIQREAGHFEHFLDRII
jgi:hypothetical protein